MEHSAFNNTLEQNTSLTLNTPTALDIIIHNISIVPKTLNFKLAGFPHGHEINRTK